MEKLQLWPMIKESLHQAMKNKKLWFFAIFAGSSGVFMQYSSQYFNQSDFSLPNYDWHKFTESLASLGTWIAFALLLLFVLLIVFITFWSRASLLLGIREAADKKKSSFKELARGGLSKIKDIFVADLMLFSVNFVGLLLMALCVWRAYQLQMWAYWPIFVVMIVFGLYNLFVSFFSHYIYCFVVYEAVKPWPAIKKAYALFLANWKTLILVKISEIIYRVVAMLCSFTLVILLMFPLLLIGLITTVLLGPTFLVVSGVLAGILVVGLLIFSQAYFNTAVYIYLTQVYWKIKK